VKYLLVIIFLLSFTQDSPNLIYWSENIKLQWKDFKAQPDLQKQYSAQTMSGIKGSGGKLTNDTLSLTIACAFIPELSWMKKDKQTPSLLEHEQLHFDIDEIFTRRFKKALKDSQLKVQTAQNQMAVIREDFKKQASAYQKLYDAETDHSIITDKQNEWNVKIAAELKSLDPYKDPVIKLRISK
jgi:hypothetical protein